MDRRDRREKLFMEKTGRQRRESRAGIESLMNEKYIRNRKDVKPSTWWQRIQMHAIVIVF